MRSNTVRTDLYWLVRVGQIIVAIVSWVATTYGILAWDSDKEVGLNTITNPSSLGVIALVGAVTIFTILLLNFSLQQKRFLNKLILGMFYLIFAFISIGFGYGFWWNKLNSTNNITYSLEQDIDRASENMVDVKSNLLGVMTQLSKLQKLSEEKNQQEEDLGGSCSNQKGIPKPGIGPFSNARKGITQSIEKLSINVNEMSHYSTNLYDDLVELIKRNKEHLKSNQFESLDISVFVKNFRREYNRKIKDSKNKEIDFSLNRINKKITVLENALKRNGTFIRPQSDGGKTIKHCTDLEILEYINILSDTLKKVSISIDNSPINLEVKDKSGRIKKALLGVWNKVMPKSLNVEKDKTFYVAPFSLALAVLFDFLLLFFTIVLYIWTTAREYYPKLQKKIEVEFGSGNEKLAVDFLEIFNKYIFEFQSKHYLVYPTLKYKNNTSSYIPINHFMIIKTKMKNIDDEIFRLVNQEKIRNIDIVNHAENRLIENGWEKEGSDSKMEIIVIKYPTMLDLAEILKNKFTLNSSDRKSELNVINESKNNSSRKRRRKY